MKKLTFSFDQFLLEPQEPTVVSICWHSSLVSLFLVRPELPKDIYGSHCLCHLPGCAPEKPGPQKPCVSLPEISGWSEGAGTHESVNLFLSGAKCKINNNQKPFQSNSWWGSISKEHWGLCWLKMQKNKIFLIRWSISNKPTISLFPEKDPQMRKFCSRREQVIIRKHLCSGDTQH